MKGTKIVRGTVALLLLAPVAWAESACVSPKVPGMQPVLKRGTAKQAIEAATSDEDPAKQEKRFRELTECAVAPGTSVEVVESGTTFDTVRVLDGSAKGCVGEILRSSLGACTSPDQ